MPYYEKFLSVAVDCESYHIDLIGHERHGQCVAMAPSTKARISEKGGVQGGLKITVEANSTHVALEQAKLIAECLWQAKEVER